MPAPAPESLPAMVSAVRMTIEWLSLRTSDRAPHRRDEPSRDRELDDVGEEERIEPGRERRTDANRRTTADRAGEERKPRDAGREDDRKAREHREERADIPAIETALGEPAGDERRERIRHQISAGRSEQSERAGRQRRRRRKYRQSCDSCGEIENLTRGSEPR